MRSKGINYSLALFISVGALGLTACGGGDGDSARLAQTVDASKNDVIDTAIAANDGYVHIKGSRQFDLIGKKKDGKEINLNSKATWTLSDKTLGSIKDGLFTASGKEGNSLILTASYAGILKEQQITLSNANLTGIEISHPVGLVDVCKNTQFIAKAIFNDGKDYDYPLTWAVDAASASLASFADTSKPELSTKKAGEIKITASGKDNTDKVVPSNELPFSISKSLTKLTLASSRDLSMRQGQTATITATGEYQNGTTATITPNVSLSSDNTSALTVNAATGLITAVSGSQSGTNVNVKATCDDIEQTIVIKVLKPDIKTMEIVGANSDTSTESLSVSVGGTITPRVKVTYVDSTVAAEIYNANDVAWAIDNTSSEYDTSNITIDTATGKLTVNDDLSLVSSLTLTISARIKNSSGGTATGSDGAELKDTIRITINR
ncbi:MAG: hypothetical protein AAGC78_16905 [Cellvibrio sp.]|uniref:hypothetical protein n=1 Tax=Cellvibrio sp. TaxID=1965322 RepID=UPI0031A4F1DC